MFRRPSQKFACKFQQQQQQQQQQSNAQLGSVPRQSPSSSQTSPASASAKPKRSSSILGKFMKRASSSSSPTTPAATSATTTATATAAALKNFDIPRQQHQTLLDEPSSPALSSNSQFSSPLSYYSDQSSLESPPMAANEKLPADWELRYDTILCQFYYVNTKENIVQFDSPLEVITH